ncbi:hypothetical protein ANO11243_083490 [Dothideomycetidae sp. 11243]|nr:hypothetical protein ANO11243_083490 [fungal sp. No.11243]
MDLRNTLERLNARFQELPEELQLVLAEESYGKLPNVVARGLLDKSLTDTLLVCCEELLPDSCSRFPDLGTPNEILGAYGRILEFAPYLSETAYDLLTSERCHLASKAPSEEPNEQLEYLLAILRLLHFDHTHFSALVDLEVLEKLSTHRDASIRVLAARVISLFLGAAETCTRRITERLLRNESDLGAWEGKFIHYRLVALWEEQRQKSIRHALLRSRDVAIPSHHQPVRYDHLSPAVASLAGILLPRNTLRPTSEYGSREFVQTPTANNNLRALGTALKSMAPILITGKAGSGKTSTIACAARYLAKLESMITLHINEQSDAKTLIGIYTTGSSPGTFSWQPGVLTKAVLEGRWVLIEDLERAPSEVMSVLLPLIERRELTIPGRNQVLRAALGFRLLATVRTVEDHRGQEHDLSPRILGVRQWNKVHFSGPTSDELPAMISGSFHGITDHVPLLIRVFTSLQGFQKDTKRLTQSRTSSLRPISQRELLNWAARVSGLVERKVVITQEEEDQIFLSAVDCFAGFLPDSDLKQQYVSYIAQECGIDPQRRDHLLMDRTITHKVKDDIVTIGSFKLARNSQSNGVLRNNSRFSINRHTARQLERIAAAISQREPLLLVGETGTGKTTSIQYLADLLGKRLIPFNLSQQSESGDMLGGFKPVNTRTIMMPLQDEFNYLFNNSFSARILVKNEQFLKVLRQCLSKQQWSRVCKCWYKALDMVKELQQSSLSVNSESTLHKDQQIQKKRKLTSLPAHLSSRWERFYASVKNVEARLQSGNNATMAFSFVEGGIVRAAREGDWVLLDEINLASSDTLEALADLFDKSPSIMLSEAGSATIIRAHPDFRIFSAMNPATDVGKKDLPSGIRSRFTELYVESPDRDLQSLQHIVQTYLGPSESVLSDITSKLHQTILKMADEGRLADGAGQKPHFSLRTLTRVLLFARDIASQCSLRRALHEGFCMSYLTLLDAESERQVLPKISESFYEKNDRLRKELAFPMKQPSHDLGHDYVQEGNYWIRSGSQPIENQPNYIITDFVQRNLNNLIRAAMTRRFPILIQGPTSSGKTSMVEYLAKKSGHKFVRINNHEHTDLQEYLGSYISGQDGKLQFQEGLLVQALREGHWIVLDELNLAPTDVLEALNRLLDDNRELLIPETQEIVRPHPNFMLFATQNPAGIYGGRKVLSRAFRNRFLELHFDDIPISELHIILERRAKIAPRWSQLIVSVYKELSMLRQEGKVFEQKGFATLRDLFRWALRSAETKQEFAENGFMLLGERCRRADERLEVKTVIEKVCSSPGPRVQIDEAALYKQLSGANLPGSIVWTGAMRRLYALTVSAVKHNEPVLLVGETGCGKTTVCQVIAQVRQQQLSIVNAHQNTETGDLIGAQRPARNRSVLESRLSELLHMIPDGRIQKALAEADLAAALSVIDNLNPLPDGVHDQVATIKDLQSQLNVLFEWKDGSLVEAMKEGHLFLLDEISLADDSVLERLNSVLEPHRSMLLAEKGSVDSFVTAADSFQFFATMNPGGDYGKKELSPALRNRFTEIWVPALSDADDILSVISAKLKDDRFAQPMFDFAIWFHARFKNSGTSTAVHIRDLLAWAEFMEYKPQGTSLEVWFLNGAAMVYMDSIGANPAGMIAINTRQVEQERQACVSQLFKIMQLQDSEAQKTAMSDEITGRSEQSRKFLDGLVGHSSRFEFERAPTIMCNVIRVARAMCLPKPILLEGPPGVGKTTLVVKLAEMSQMPLTRINLSEQTDLMDLFGSDVPTEGQSLANFAWRDAPFLRAMRAGEWVLLDEMNLASQSVLEGLNACLDHRGEVFIPELNQTFYKHQNFRLFAAQNPHHQGGGRKGLPSSFVNRFTVVYADTLVKKDIMGLFGFTENDEHSELDAVVDFLDSLNTMTSEPKFGLSGGPWEFNLRDIGRWYELAESKRDMLVGFGYESFLNTIIVQRFRSEAARRAVTELFHQLFPNSLKRQSRLDAVYNMSEKYVQVGLGLMPRDEVMSPRLTRLYDHYDIKPNMDTLESLMICLRENWPVLLVGPSGVGKTTLVERLADTVGANVSVFALNAEVDSTDLVGGYEQHDPLRDIHTFARDLQRLSRRLLLNGYSRGNSQRTITGLWKASQDLLALSEPPGLSAIAGLKGITQILCRLGESDELNVKAQCLKLAEDLGQILKQEVFASGGVHFKGRFEWIDGTLIQAMERGDWLILDNANLCNPAVLDRLNSLLEPNGRLLINEHTDDDGQARCVVPHPSFRVIVTVDPKHGELSRALRNRCVELFMLPKYAPGVSAETSSFDLDAVHHHDSHHARYAHVKFMTEEPLRSSASASLLTERLGLTDLGFKNLILQDMASGLFNADRKVVEAISMSLDAWTSTVLQLHASDVDIDINGLTGTSELQMINPANNYLYSQVVDRLRSVEHPPFSTFALKADLVRWKIPMAKALDEVRATYRPGTVASKLHESVGQEHGTGAFTALEAALHLLQKTLESDVSRMDVEVTSQLIDQIRFSWWDLYDYFGTKGTPEIVLQILWWRCLTDLTRKSKAALISGPSLMLSNLQQLIAAWQSCAGPGAFSTDVTYIDAFWDALRPSTIPSEELYNRRLALERLVTKFDDRFWILPMPIDEAVSLRNSISKVLLTQPKDDVAHGEASQLIDNVFRQLEHDNRPKEPMIPFLQSEFERLAQLIDLWRSSSVVLDQPHSDTIVNAVYIIAGRSTKSISQTSSQKIECGTQPETRLSLRLLCSFRGVDGIHTSDEQLTGDFSLTILRKLQFVDHSPIRQIGLLRYELITLGNIVATNTAVFDTAPCFHLQNVLKKLVPEILEVMVGNSSTVADEKLRHFQNQIGGQFVTENDNSTPAASRLETSGLTEKNTQIMMTCLRPTIFFLQKAAPDATPTDPQPGRLLEFARAWLSFFVGCVLLYTPDMSYDPAINAQLAWELHQRHVRILSEEADALKHLEAYISGTTQSSRIRAIESKIHDYLASSNAQEPRVWRSSKWDAGPLQVLLKTLSQIMVRFNPQSVDESAMLAAANDTQIRWSIDQIQRRFNTGLEEFRDFTEPLESFLNGLQIGFDLVDLAAAEESSTTSNRGTLALLPMAGCKPELMHFIDDPMTLRPEPRTVKVLGVLKAMQPNASKQENAKTAFYTSIRECYWFWKQKLESEQVKNAVRSSLYRYRGDAELEAEVEEDEFLELFSDSEIVDRAKAQDNLDLQRYSSEVAVAVETYFGIGSTVPKGIVDLLDDTTDFEPRTEAHGSSVSESDYIPSMIRQIDRSLASLSANSFNSKQYNIYTDTNMSQITAMMTIIADVEIKFGILQKAWPEHATLEDVLRTCNELSAFAHSDPLVKVLTKLEKLHEYIHEWQTVASKEYSAAASYDAVTDLIVSWRQLELSTWSRMLDVEAVKCQDEAKSWFFLAYESIVAASESNTDTDMHGSTLTTELIGLLERFMRSTGLGQFHARLQILSDLHELTKIQALNAGRVFVQVSHALANFVSYMNHFKNPVKDAIAKGRAALDKDMKNVIQLASWKDRNILTLRQSAKNSHRKLFKVIRKFRSLLGEPVEPIILGGLKRTSATVGHLSLPSVRHQYEFVEQLDDALPRLQAECMQKVVGWSDLPPRFRNTSVTAELVGSLSRFPTSAMSSEQEISLWLADLLNEAELLKKATPSNLTMENKATAQHLKARKRALFADTLKHLRTMGFKSNVSTDVLSRQGSLAAVFASTLASTGVLAFEAAETDLFELLHYIPTARNASREHSEDLTGAEVGRSVALLESMLHNILLQRGSAVEHAAQSESFADCFAQLRNLVLAQDISPVPELYDIDPAKLQDCVSSTAGMLGAGTEIMQAQFRLAKQDGTETVKSLTTMSEGLKNLSEQWNTLPKMPSGLGYSKLTQHKNACSEAFVDINSRLDEITEKDENLQPLLRQIKYWFPPSITPTVNPLTPSVRAEQIQQSTLQLIDRMLVGVQAMSKVLENLPCTSEDPLWLIKEISTLNDALKKLSFAAITSDVSDILGNLRHMGKEECQTAVTLLLTLSPIIAAFQDVHERLLDRMVRVHTAVTKMSVHLARIFVSLAKEGFCSPREGDAESNGAENSKVEAGTGLGDGEGAEDISKDIGDDEDLTELAQEENQNETSEELDDEKDAVDMADAELEGEMGEGETKEEGEGESDSEAQEDLEEEAGSVDDLGENTVDEKMWDEGGEKDADKDQTADKANGTKDKDEVTAAGEDKKDKGQDREEGEEVEEELLGADEEESGPPQDAERADPTMQEQENLDLPDDIDIDGQKGEEDLDDDDLDMSDDQETKDNDAEMADAEGDDLATEQPGEVPDDDLGNEVDDEVGDEPEEALDERPGDELDQELDKPTDEAGEDVEEDVPQDQDNILQDNRQDDSVAADQAIPSDSRGTGLAEDEQQEDVETDPQAGAAERPQGSEGETQDMQQASGKQGQRGEVDQDQAEEQEDQAQDDSDPAESTYKKLGNALENWYKRQREIQDSRDPEENANKKEARADLDATKMEDVEFEHLPDEDTEADAQALGAAREDEATAIDDAGTGVNENERRDQFPEDQDPEAEPEGEQNDVDKTTAETNEPAADVQMQDEDAAKAFVGERSQADEDGRRSRSTTPMSVDREDEPVAQTDSSLQRMTLSGSSGDAMSIFEAQNIWQAHESRTRMFALQLQEQLRLILNPTQSSKLRGDFRTGKRLNIKRIIPYIASNYKRDKIWLRRSVPSKRQYQIMLAVDDSRSMAEAGVDAMAFDTLALVSKALTMLEAGELSVVGFGKDITVPVRFGDTIGPDRGAEVVQQLRFDQHETNVKLLLEQAATMFDDAALRRSGPQDQTWQLMLILGDGVINKDIDGVRQAERNLRDKGVMVVFVIVDPGSTNKQSIMDLQNATFSKDQDGNASVQMRRYIEMFPFRFYLIVRHVAELPGVLASALRQWFAEVAESG